MNITKHLTVSKQKCILLQRGERMERFMSYDFDITNIVFFTHNAIVIEYSNISLGFICMYDWLCRKFHI